MPNQVLVIHERIGFWARQLRARLASATVRVVESRSGADLEAGLAGSACPLLVLDLGDRPRAGLDDLDRALRSSPEALALVLDPGSHEGAGWLAREIGATHVMAGPVAPPAVAGLLARWLPVAQRRAESAGWSAPSTDPPGPEPWNWLTPLLEDRAARD